MDQGLTRQSPYGVVRLGAFREVLDIPGRYLNDHCLVWSGSEWHFFGIVGTVAPEGKPYGTPPLEVSLAHATSPDLIDWQVHPDVLEKSGDWPEIRHLFAPNIMEHDGLFYMLYCASDEQRSQYICLATSEDLFQWQRYPGNPVIVPSAYWSKWPGFGLDEPDGGTFGGCRDPHILKLPDGRFLAYWVSRLNERHGTNLTCVAASVSHDLVHWQEVGPIFALEAWEEQPSLEVESPCVVHTDGRYWLFFKHGWWTYVANSESPFDFWGHHAQRLGFSHASEVLHWKGRWWITHCSGAPDDFMYRKTNRTRGLFLGTLDWPPGEWPRFSAEAP